MAHKPDERCAVSAPEIDRLNRWRHFGDGPATYTAGSKQFGDDVIVALIEIERLRNLILGACDIFCQLDAPHWAVEFHRALEPKP